MKDVLDKEIIPIISLPGAYLTDERLSSSMRELTRSLKRWFKDN